MQKQVDPIIEADLEISADFSQLPNADQDASPNADSDCQFAGIELATYASQHAIGTSQVWELVRQGKLAARTERGRVFVYERAIEDDDLTPLTPPATISLDNLPPLPTKAPAQQHALTPAAPTPEVALLLDHLSLAKEEHREIIRLTQDSISRITSMTEQLIASKDALLKDREEQLREKTTELSRRDSKLEAAEEDIARRDATIAKLKQDLEDMEILTRTLSPN